MKTVRLETLPTHVTNLIAAVSAWAEAEMEANGRVRPVVIGTDACDIRLAVHKPKTKSLGGGEPAP